VSEFPPVAALLPHSGEMVLLDEVISCEGERTVCRVKLRPEALFVEDGKVPAVVAIEWMAQTVGVYAGLRARAAGEPPRIGYLLGTRELTLELDHLDVGDEIDVEALHVFGDEQLGSFHCAAFRGGRRFAAATLNVYQGRGEEIPS
jgi:predicted hotdog family 3-hydroxylacyl-ACP dehydratase